MNATMYYMGGQMTSLDQLLLVVDQMEEAEENPDLLVLQ